MTLSSSGSREERKRRKKAQNAVAEPDYPIGADGRPDRDIRNHPSYKTPWWRRPLKPWMLYTLGVVLIAIIVAAILVCISLGIKLF